MHKYSTSLNAVEPSPAHLFLSAHGTDHAISRRSIAVVLAGDGPGKTGADQDDGVRRVMICIQSRLRGVRRAQIPIIRFRRAGDEYC